MRGAKWVEDLIPGAYEAIERSLGPPNVECPVCEGEGWRCEEHPDLPFPHDDCAGPGMPCLCRPGAR